METTLIVQIAMVALAMALAFWRGRWRLIASGLKRSTRTFQSLWLRILLGFTLSGLLQDLLPREFIARMLGPASGLKGILLGSFAGIFLTGGPYVRMPIIASMASAGAAAGPVIALVMATQLIGLYPLVIWEIPFFGLKLPLARFLVCLVITPIVAVAGAALFQLYNSV
ncbi:MAG: permease [Desulfobacterales bacterium]|nr:permease [Desulfobacterales bacterium]